MPDWTKAAAEEISQGIFDLEIDVDSGFPIYDRFPDDEIAAIIARHAEGERKRLFTMVNLTMEANVRLLEALGVALDVEEEADHEP